VIVVDASVIVDLLLDVYPYSQLIAKRITEESPNIFAPHLIDAEVAQVLRRFEMRDITSSNRTKLALEDLLDLPIIRYPHAPFIERAFSLRHNVTIYDALYLVLAEVLEVPLLTRDLALKDIPDVNVQVDLIPNEIR